QVERDQHAAIENRCDFLEHPVQYDFTAELADAGALELDECGDSIPARECAGDLVEARRPDVCEAVAKAPDLADGVVGELRPGDVGYVVGPIGDTHEIDVVQQHRHTVGR